MNKLAKLRRRPYLGTPYVTYSLIGICVFIFLITEIIGSSLETSTLLLVGAKDNELVIQGQWWRLISAMFVHIGISHIVFNGLIIYFLGIQLEQIFGHWRFLVLCLLTGIAGNVGSFAFTAQVSAGASTFIYGMFGSTLILPKLFPNNPSIRALSRNFLIFVLINVVTDFLSFGVDNFGHLGGLLAGVLITVVLSAPRAKEAYSKNKRILFGFLYLGFILFTMILGYTQSLYFNLFQWIFNI